MKGKPEVIPLLLLKGRTTLFREYSKKAISELSKSLRKRDFEKLYVLDLDGVERNKPQLDIVQVLSDDFSIFYEAGPRRGANVVDLVIAGADKVYMNTYSMSALDEVKVALTFTENIGLKIDWNDTVLGHGDGIEGCSLSDIIAAALGLGVKDFVVPAEVTNEAGNSLKGANALMRAIADRPGDEKIVNPNVESLIIPLENLPKEVDK